MKKRIILCADDYGQNTAISQGILSLIQQQKLSATSCMTNMPTWPEMAAPLREYKNKIDIGLHFNLTDGNALTKEAQIYFGNLNRLIKQAFLKQLNQQIIEAELKAQLDAFISATGFLPDYIDGHQHIHHLPIIRSALLNVYQQYFSEKKAYIRISSNSLIQAIKQSFRCWKILIITLTGALQLKKELIKKNIPHNATFSGIYNFAANKNYAAQFKIFLKEVDEGGLIMCHPGLTSDAIDPIYATRNQEFNYLKSEELLQNCTLIRGIR